MSIQVKLRDLVMSQAAFKELSSYKPTGKFGYNAAKLIRLANAEIEDFSKLEQTHIEKYGTLDANKKGYEFKTLEDARAFKTANDEALNADVTLEINLLDYKDIEILTPTIGLWNDLSWAISDPTSK